MDHSRKSLLALIIALIVGSVSAYLLLDLEWFQQLLPGEIPDEIEVVSVWAMFTIFTFDVMVLVLEQASSE